MIKLYCLSLVIFDRKTGKTIKEELIDLYNWRNYLINTEDQPESIVYTGESKDINDCLEYACEVLRQELIKNNVRRINYKLEDIIVLVDLELDDVASKHVEYNGYNSRLIL